MGGKGARSLLAHFHADLRPSRQPTEMRLHLPTPFDRRAKKGLGNLPLQK
jgi:hypothetical protein